MKAPLVSVLMPLYNSERFVREAIDSVVGQSYGNWELVIVDDRSTDSSAEIAEAYEDSRIRVVRHSSNQGVAIARNTALEIARGDYIAFLDSDDVWFENKLEHQIAFMEREHVGMCFTSYETIEEDGAHRNFVKVPDRIDYEGFLKNTVTCSHTILFDLAQVQREWLFAPVGKDYDFPEDMAVWLGVLKHGVCARGLDEVLAQNRKRSESRSADKFKAVRRTWNQYRYGEGMGVARSAYCLAWQVSRAIAKRI